MIEGKTTQELSKQKDVDCVCGLGCVDLGLQGAGQVCFAKALLSSKVPLQKDCSSPVKHSSG